MRSGPCPPNPPPSATAASPPPAANSLRTAAPGALLLAVPPGLAQGGDLAVKDGQLIQEIVVELLQPRGEPADLLRIGDSLGHA